MFCLTGLLLTKEIPNTVLYNFRSIELYSIDLVLYSITLLRSANKNFPVKMKLCDASTALLKTVGTDKASTLWNHD